jgi:mRNA interferase MazF
MSQALAPGDIIKVPFPYANHPVFQRHPALVVALFDHERIPALLWVLMITSAENRGWPEDVEIADMALAGLPVALGVCMAKIATIEQKDAERIGKIPESKFLEIVKELLAVISLSFAPNSQALTACESVIT